MRNEIVGLLTLEELADRFFLLGIKPLGNHSLVDCRVELCRLCCAALRRNDVILNSHSVL